MELRFVAFLKVIYVCINNNYGTEVLQCVCCVV